MSWPVETFSLSLPPECFVCPPAYLEELCCRVCGQVDLNCRTAHPAEPGKAAVTPAQHFCCSSCIFQWLNRQPSQPTCPTCQLPIASRGQLQPLGEETRHEIAKAPVKCPYCSVWTGSFVEAFERHFAECTGDRQCCRFANAGCGFVEVPALHPQHLAFAADQHVDLLSKQAVDAAVILAQADHLAIDTHNRQSSDAKTKDSGQSESRVPALNTSFRGLYLSTHKATDWNRSRRRSVGTQSGTQSGTLSGTNSRGSVETASGFVMAWDGFFESIDVLRKRGPGGISHSPTSTGMLFVDVGTGLQRSVNVSWHVMDSSSESSSSTASLCNQRLVCPLVMRVFDNQWIQTLGYLVASRQLRSNSCCGRGVGPVQRWRTRWHYELRCPGPCVGLGLLAHNGFVKSAPRFSCFPARLVLDGVLCHSRRASTHSQRSARYCTHLVVLESPFPTCYTDLDARNAVLRVVEVTTPGASLPQEFSMPHSKSVVRLNYIFANNHELEEDPLLAADGVIISAVLRKSDAINVEGRSLIDDMEDEASPAAHDYVLLDSMNENSLSPLMAKSKSLVPDDSLLVSVTNSQDCRVLVEDMTSTMFRLNVLPSIEKLLWLALLTSPSRETHGAIVSSGWKFEPQLRPPDSVLWIAGSRQWLQPVPNPQQNIRSLEIDKQIFLTGEHIVQVVVTSCGIAAFTMSSADLQRLVRQATVETVNLRKFLKRISQTISDTLMFDDDLRTLNVKIDEIVCKYSFCHKQTNSQIMLPIIAQGILNASDRPGTDFNEAKFLARLIAHNIRRTVGLQGTGAAGLNSNLLLNFLWNSI